MYAEATITAAEVDQEIKKLNFQIAFRQYKMCRLREMFNEMQSYPELVAESKGVQLVFEGLAVLNLQAGTRINELKSLKLSI